MQVAGDPVAVLEEREPPLVVLARASSSASAAWSAKALAAGRSTSWNGPGRRRRAGPADRTPARPEPPAPRGSCGRAARRHVGIGAAQRLGALERLGDDGVRAVDQPAGQPVRLGARGRPDHLALAVPCGQGHDGQVGVGDRPCPPRDPSSASSGAPLAQQRRGDLGRRLQPRSRRVLSRYRRAFSIATPAAAASATTISSSSLGELAARRASRSGRGCRTPRRGSAPARRGSCASAGGAAGSRTTAGAGGCRAAAAARAASMSSPSTPLPVRQVADRARAPRRRCPWMMNSASSPPPAPSTPRAPYRAPTSSRAASTIRRSTCCAGRGRCRSRRPRPAIGEPGRR